FYLFFYPKIYPNNEAPTSTDGASVLLASSRATFTASKRVSTFLSNAFCALSSIAPEICTLSQYPTITSSIILSVWAGCLSVAGKSTKGLVTFLVRWVDTVPDLYTPVPESRVHVSVGSRVGNARIKVLISVSCFSKNRRYGTGAAFMRTLPSTTTSAVAFVLAKSFCATTSNNSILASFTLSKASDTLI